MTEPGSESEPEHSLPSKKAKLTLAALRGQVEEYRRKVSALEVELEKVKYQKASLQVTLKEARAEVDRQVKVAKEYTEKKFNEKKEEWERASWERGVQFGIQSALVSQPACPFNHNRSGYYRRKQKKAEAEAAGADKSAGPSTE